MHTHTAITHFPASLFCLTTGLRASHSSLEEAGEERFTMADCTGLEAIKSWPQLESWIGVWSLVWLEWVSEWVTRSLSLALLRWQWETHTTNSYSSAQLKPMFVQGSTTYHKDKSEPSQRRYADKTTILVGNENNILYWLYTDLMTVTERPWLCEKLTTPQRLNASKLQIVIQGLSWSQCFSEIDTLTQRQIRTVTDYWLIKTTILAGKENDTITTESWVRTGSDRFLARL